MKPNTLIFGHDEKVAAWVAKQIPDVENGFGACKAVAICSGNNPIAGVVYHSYSERARTVQISIASISPRWATPQTICDVLAVPFYQYRCLKVWAMTAHDNERAVRFLSQNGWVREAILRHQFGKKRHAHIYGMMDYEYTALRAKLLPHETIKDAA